MRSGAGERWDEMVGMVIVWIAALLLTVEGHPVLFTSVIVVGLLAALTSGELHNYHMFDEELTRKQMWLSGIHMFLTLAAIILFVIAVAVRFG